ncbi:MAG: phosphotransferase [Proteobacteria bacterium]|nr:phosphotransferase [Pseudomonadota bacterium]
MALHARLDRSAVEGLARRFGIGDITAFSVMEGGHENTSYCVETSSGRYVLTLSDQKSLRHVTNLAKLLVYLTDRGIRTSQVVVPPKDPIVVLHDEKPVMLKRYVDGDVTAEVTGNLLVQLGEEMARLHEIPAPSYVPQSFPYGRSYFPEVTNSDLGHTYVDWLSEKNSYLQKRIPQHLPMALIHGDVFFDNMIIQRDQLMAIIDFEEACHYYRCFDLGMVIVGACRDRKGISFEKAGRFIRAYQKEKTLQSLERKTLKTFAVYAAVATSFWRFRQYHLRRPEPRLYDEHVEMQTLADTISEYPDSRFTELFAEKTTAATSGKAT